MTAANGSAAMAARSLRLTASALRPTRRGSISAKLEIDVVAEQIHGDDALLGAGHLSTAASSPGPSRNSG